MKFEKILFPVDFSPRCEAARPLVQAMARKFGAKVTVFYAIQLPQNLYALERSYPITLDVDQMMADARDELRRFYPCEGTAYAAEIGDVTVAITNFAQNNGIDLIMMPTHGYGKFRGLLLGSVTAKVLHDATCPVWTTAHTDDPALAAHADCKSVVCALDLEEGSLDLLRRAADFAATTGATLRLAHAISEISPVVAAYGGVSAMLLDAARESTARLQKEAGTNFEVDFGPAPAAGWIHEVASIHRADLVIAGRGKLHRNFGRLRTNAYSIIRESPCPVLSF
jgi:nucleotide-binding universal stress UspA family protein